MDDNWECYKDKIQQHYLTENKPLKEVMDFMEKTFSFYARYLLATRPMK
jgi:hypothetical protein